MAIMKRRKSYVDDVRSIKTECDLYILMDVLNLRHLEFLVSKGYKISGVFTNLSQLELELSTNMGRFRLLIIDSGCGNFGNNTVLKSLNNIISLCVGGNKCTFLTSNMDIIGLIKTASVENASSLMIKDYDGILGVYNVLEYLNEDYKGSNNLKESLENAILDSYKLDLEVITVEENNRVKQQLNNITSDYLGVVKSAIEILGIDGNGIKSYNNIKY